MKFYYFLVIIMFSITFGVAKGELMYGSLTENINNYDIDVTDDISDYNATLCANSQYGLVSLYSVSGVITKITPDYFDAINAECKDFVILINMTERGVGISKDKIIAITSDTKKEVLLNVNRISSVKWNVTQNSFYINTLPFSFGKIFFETKNYDTKSPLFLDLTEEGEKEFFFLSDDKVSIEPNETKIIDLLWQSGNTSQGQQKVYKVNLFDVSNNSANITVVLNISDITPPEITYIDINPRISQISNNVIVRVNIKDNVYVRDVWMFAEEKTGNATEIIKKSFTRINNTLFETTMANQTKGGLTEYMFYGGDNNGNNVVGRFNISVEAGGIVNLQKTVYFYTFLYKTSRSIIIGEISKPTNLTFEMTDFDYTDVSNFTFLEIYINGKMLNYEKQMLENIEGDISITAQQIQTFENATFEPKQFNGVIKITGQPEWEIINPEIRFSGKLNNFSLALPMIVETFATSTLSGTLKANYTCNPQDSDYYETTQWGCYVSFPRGDIETNTFRFLGDTNAIELEFGIKNSQINTLNLEKKGMSDFILWEHIILVLAVFAVIMYTYVIADWLEYRV